MKERPILFSAPMVRAILEGRKTQTRRIIKMPKEVVNHPEWLMHNLVFMGKAHFNTGRAPARGPMMDWDVVCPYGKPGDRLWVRETFQPIYPQDPLYNCGKPICYDYAATYRHGDRLGDAIGEKKKWNPSIHMPRWASRITLEVTGVRVERLRDISGSDAVAEGVRSRLPDNGVAVAEYRDLWQSINGAGSWEANPWVWVIEFEVVK